MQRHIREELQRAELVGSVLMMDDMIKYLKMFYALTMVVLSWIATSLEVFIRYDFGERYLNWVRLYFAWAMIWAFAIFLPSLFGEPDYFFFAIYAVFILLSLWHRLAIHRRNKKGIPWHSMCTGVSHLSFLPVKEWTLYLYVEPFLFLLISVLLWKFIGGFVGTWLIVSSICLLAKNQMEYYNQRSQLLDMIDARIEAQYFNQALTNQGEKKRDTEGFTVAPVNVDHLFSDEAPDITATVEETLQNNPSNDE